MFTWWKCKWCLGWNWATKAVNLQHTRCSRCYRWSDENAAL